MRIRNEAIFPNENNKKQLIRASLAMTLCASQERSGIGRQAL
jgi:hypothetical protein